MTTPYKGNYGYGFVVSEEVMRFLTQEKSTNIMPLLFLPKTKIKFI